MSNIHALIAILAFATFAIRIGGVVAGDAIAQVPILSRVLDVLPGCLIVSLVTTAVVTGGWTTLLAASAALTVALPTRNLVLTMLAGMGTAALLANIHS